MQNREKLRQKGHDGSKKNDMSREWEKISFLEGGGDKYRFRTEIKTFVVLFIDPWLFTIFFLPKIYIAFSRDLNAELVELGHNPVKHSFDIWHLIKVCRKYLDIIYYFTESKTVQYYTLVYSFSKVVSSVSDPHGLVSRIRIPNADPDPAADGIVSKSQKEHIILSYSTHLKRFLAYLFKL
jgi:hypothetical protein